MGPAIVQLWNARWHFALNMKGDGVFTITDVGLMAKYVFFAPGDALILSVLGYQPALATFFEMDASWLYSWKSTVISIIAWILALRIIGEIVFEMEEKSRARAAARQAHRQESERSQG
jgi:hypothetical protein